MSMKLYLNVTSKDTNQVIFSRVQKGFMKKERERGRGRELKGEKHK